MMVCFNCGRITPKREFCLNCHTPLVGSFQPPETSHGVPLAQTEKGFFALPLRFFGRHFGIYGVTGSGKSRFSMNLAVRAENAGLNLRILDVEGEWKSIIPKLQKEVVYYDVDVNLKLNPFEVGDLQLTKLLLKETMFKGIEFEYRELSPQMKFLLDKCIQKSGSIPELMDNVITHTPRLPFRMVNLDATRTALLTRLNPYKDNPVLRSIFYVSKSSIDMAAIGNRNLIVDLHDLDRKVAYKLDLRLIYSILTTAYLREALGREEVPSVRNMFIADEAQLLVPKILRKAVITDTWATTDFATRLRKRGESLVMITQSPFNIEDDIRRNAQNIFVFRLNDPDDMRTAAGMMGFVQADEVAHLSDMMSNLERRRAIVKTPLVRNPFLATSLDLQLDPISADDLKKLMPRVDSRIQLEEEENRFLESLETMPFLPMVARRRLLGWDKDKYSRVVAKLVESRLIDKVPVAKGAGRPIVLYQFNGHRPGVKHEYYVNWIAEELEKKGYSPSKGRTGPDIQIPEVSTAINVEMGKSTIRENIQQALRDYETVIVCSDKKEKLERYERENDDERVLFSDVWNVPGFFGVNGG